MAEQPDNTDTRELEKFDRLSREWWDPAGKLKTLHVINPLRLQYIDDAAAIGGRRVLDIGCGGGLLSEAMAARGARVTGLDANASLIEVARDHARQSGLRIDYHAATAEEHAAESKDTYDVITCMELLEHVPEPGRLLGTCAGMLAPGGDLVIATLNRNAHAYASAILGAEYILKLLPRGTHDYGRFLRPSEIAACLRKHAIDVIDISGMRYVPGAERCFLNRDPAVNYLLHGRAQL